MYTNAKYTQNRAYSLQFKAIKFIRCDFWGWGLSAWPLRTVIGSSWTDARETVAAGRAPATAPSTHHKIYIYIYIYRERERENQYHIM